MYSSVYFEMVGQRGSVDQPTRTNEMSRHPNQVNPPDTMGYINLLKIQYGYNYQKEKILFLRIFTKNGGWGISKERRYQED